MYARPHQSIGLTGIIRRLLLVPPEAESWQFALMTAESRFHPRAYAVLW